MGLASILPDTVELDRSRKVQYRILVAVTPPLFEIIAFSSSRAAVGTGVLVSLTGECVVAGTEGGSGEPCLLLLLRIVVGLELTATS